MILISVLLLFFQSFQAYGEIPNLDDCRISINVYNLGSFLKPSKYFDIQSLWNNGANSDEIVNIQIYFKGSSYFSVVLSEDQTASGAIFQTSKFGSISFVAKLNNL